MKTLSIVTVLICLLQSLVCQAAGRPVPGKKYLIQAHDGRFFGLLDSVGDGKGVKLVAEEYAALYEIIEVHDGRIALKSEYGQYLTATLERNLRGTNALQPWGEFLVETSDANTFALKSVHNTFLSAKRDSGVLSLYPQLLVAERLTFIEYDISHILDEYVDNIDNKDSHSEQDIDAAMASISALVDLELEPKRLAMRLPKAERKRPVHIADLFGLLGANDVALFWFPLESSKGRHIGHVTVKTKEKYFSLYISKEKKIIYLQDLIGIQEGRVIKRDLAKIEKAHQENKLKFAVFRLTGHDDANSIKKINDEITKWEGLLKAGKSKPSYGTIGAYIKHDFVTNLKHNVIKNSLPVCALAASVGFVGFLGACFIAPAAVVSSPIGIAILGVSQALGSATTGAASAMASSALGAACAKAGIVCVGGTAALTLAQAVGAKVDDKFDQAALDCNKEYEFTNCAMAARSVVSCCFSGYDFCKPRMPYSLLEAAKTYRSHEQIISEKGFAQIETYGELWDYFKNYDPNRIGNHTKRRI